MDIVIVGTGYVGLVTGACFAERGHVVTCLDIDSEKIENLRLGQIPIYEPGLEEIVKQNTSKGRLKFTTDYRSALRGAAACFIAVPTPSRDDGSCDLSYVEKASRQIAQNLSGYCVLVNKSTVPVGTADRVKCWVEEVLKEKNSPIAFDVVSNPEFLKEGAAIRDCLFPDRIVIGSDSSKPAELLKEIYAPFCQNNEEDKILLMDPRSAEMTKYAANAMLATRISFMNEIADTCKRVGANVNHVRLGIGNDPRIGPRFLFPGPGYGGSCFPKDIRALISISKEAGSQPTLLQAVDSVNEQQKKILAHQIVDYFSRRSGVEGKTIAIWGLSFKPDTDDMREAPSLTVIDHLLKFGAHLRLYDPVAMNNAKKIIAGHPKISWCENEWETAQGADAIVLITEWKRFSEIDFSQVMKRMNNYALFDGRNQYNPQEIVRLGFDYICIGAPDHIHKKADQ